MDGTNIKLSIFNGNVLEYLEKHWFLCEVVWTMRQVEDGAIKKPQLITTLRGHALDKHLTFFVVPVGFAQKTLYQIQVEMINEFKKLKFESQCIT